MLKTFILNYDQRENEKIIKLSLIHEKCNKDIYNIFEKLKITKPENFNVELETIDRHSFSFELDILNYSSNHLFNMLKDLSCQSFFIF